MQRNSYTQSEQSEEDAEMLIASNRRHQRSRDDIAFVALLKACTKQKDLCKGSRVHADILERGLLKKNIFIGNTLVSMYAKCGALAEAQQVFEDLPHRDVVSWNALAAGYTQHGLSEVAVGCFYRMQHEGLSPDAVTFACILKACGNMRAAEQGKKIHACILTGCDNIGVAENGKEIHAEIAKKGLLGNGALLESALLDMYAKCGALARAQQVFDELPARDVVSWTALMAGYCEQGHGNEAIECFEKMQEEGISPDVVTFTCILKACGSVGYAEKGKEIHAELVRRQLLGKDMVVGSALVDMYAKCGELTKAQEVFDKLLVQDVVSWTALIGGYCEHGHTEEALNCFEVIKHKNLPLDAVTFACILKACGSIGALEKGENIHAEIVQKGLLGNGTILEGALLDMYVKCGALAKAQQVFEELTIRDLVSWTVLIAGYCEQGYGEKALNCFQQLQGEGISADAVTISWILKACGSRGAVELGEEVHAEIVRKQWVGNDIVLGSALVDMYTKCGLLAKARQVFDMLPDRDLISWTVLITGYCEHGHGEEALYCCEQMKQEGFSPNAVTLACILKACGSIGAAATGKKVHAEIVAKGLLANNIVLGNALVDMYAKCGAFAKAKQLFDELPSRDVVSWNGMIARCFEYGHNEEALNYYEQMKHDVVSPDALTFTCILKACGSTGATEKGKEIHTEMVKLGLLENNSVLGNALVDMYAKCDVIAKAQQVFDKLPIRDVVSWNSLMIGYCQNGHSKQVFNCFKKMKDDGFFPDAVTFACILKASGSTGAAETSQMYFTTMSTSYGITPTAEHHTCMVGLLGRVGLFDKAMTAIEKMPSFDYLPTWFALLDACRNQGNVKLGRLAFEHAAQLNIAMYK